MTKTAPEQPARAFCRIYFQMMRPPIIRGESQSKIQGATARADV
ncbi:hypothetical protein BCO71171_07312 [Burkholderia contaminans]|uniref:Uncharacterized protein n=1 Tax=Burkholderia contaminans TaxID=488447 RepID=A0A6P3BX04_9BURK|nr:hypothetical protein BCO71171_07312 [Burkholderia contaminans]